MCAGQMNAKIALVTGASRGLGKDMALALARGGHDVIVTYHSNKDAADAVVKSITQLGRKAVPMQLDIGNISALDKAASALKAVLDSTWGTQRFDYLVHNGGFGANSTVEQTTEEVFDQLCNAHFKGVFFLTQKLLPLLNDGAGIVIISSGLTRFSMPGMAAYACMKGASEVLARYLAKELGPRGIRANIVAPGAIETDFGGGHVRDSPEINRMIAAQTPLDRVGKPDDIGGVVAFLCSEDAKWINGQRMEVSGGINV